MLKKSISLIFISMFLFLSCGRNRTEVETHVRVLRFQSPENINLIYKQATNLEVEVMYEPGANPYTGKSFRNIDYWDMLEENVKHVYSIRNQAMNVSVPKELNQMSIIPSQNKSSWTIPEIEQVVSQYSKSNSTSNKVVFKVLFVNGAYKYDGEVKNNIIGINISHTTIIVIFKDVIKRLDMANPLNGAAKYAEQSTLVHEFGHAIGIVNNGIPMKNHHQDEDHGSHCTNTDCVMYWLNAGNEDIADLINRYITQGRNILYGQECLNDIQNFK